ncbi:Flp pilus assembly protein CpaB [Luteitalea sp.]|jgi:pilus assembly protein CpaB|uniref:Flp pilus assembly protein CpaB n=1 Tax=Luteitalea sp. TaxID=2004800 RepID=UPI0037CC2768
MSGRAKLLLSLVLGLLAVFLVYVYVRGIERQLYEEVDMQNVVVTRAAIAAGTAIDQGQIQRIAVPRKYRQPQTFPTVEEVAGRVAVVPIAAGTQVSGSMLADAGAEALSFEVPRGRRAVAITVTDDTGVGGLIRPGNFVDIVGTFEFGRPVAYQNGRVQYADEKTEVRTMMQNVFVVAVNKELRRERVERETQGSAGTAPPQTRERSLRTVTLLVEPNRVQELILAQNVGDLTLSLRSSLDDTAVNLPFLDPMQLLGVTVPVKPKARPLQSFRDVGRGLF